MVVLQNCQPAVAVSISVHNWTMEPDLVLERARYHVAPPIYLEFLSNFDAKKPASVRFSQKRLSYRSSKGYGWNFTSREVSYTKRLSAN